MLNRKLKVIAVLIPPSLVITRCGEYVVCILFTSHSRPCLLGLSNPKWSQLERICLLNKRWEQTVQVGGIFIHLYYLYKIPDKSSSNLSFSATLSHPLGKLFTGGILLMNLRKVCRLSSSPSSFSKCSLFSQDSEHRVTSRCILRTNTLTQSGSYRCQAKTAEQTSKTVGWGFHKFWTT